MDDQLRRKHPLVTQDPRVMVGKPTLRGTRLTVEAVVRAVAAEGGVEGAARTYDIPAADVKAALLYAADHVRAPYKLVNEDDWEEETLAAAE